MGSDFLGSNLYGADFYNAKLECADFTDADLRCAEFEKATLKGSVLMEADLRTPKHLEKEQLCNVITLYGAKLDANLRKYVEENCEERLDEPEEEAYLPKNRLKPCQE